MFELTNPVQKYAWGMKDWLPRFLGCKNESNEPWAELWMGAHPKASSLRQRDGVSLDSLVAEKGSELLGASVYEEYGRLPFLFKVLAVEEPLSIQVHPSQLQAIEGFEKENRAGIDLSAFKRNYRDNNHKPEIICAVEPFTAMKGFRPYHEIKANFNPIIEQLEPDLFGGGTIRDFYFSLMALKQEDKIALLDRASRNLSEDLKGRWVKKLQKFYPGDISTLAPLYLNLVVLQKGEALFLPSGELHAYLYGVGIELMANSDNVLRGGLTPKHIDLDELGKVVCFDSSSIHLLKKDEDNYYYSGADEFRLGEKSITGEFKLDNNEEAAIVLVFSGKIEFFSGKKTISASKGEALFIESGHKSVELKGKGLIYWATIK
jgi:mannose-6-phosphate isomerase